MEPVANYTALKTRRYERKFPFDANHVEEAERFIKFHPGFFTEIYAARWINNIYFDTARMDFYNDNQAGKSDRKKIRIRWYGDLFGKVLQPVLEVKIKNGLAGSKRSFPLPSFDFHYTFDMNQLHDLFAQADLPEDVLLLVNAVHPTLVNRYQRKYFKDMTKDFRITLDWDMSYYNVTPGVNTFQNTYIDKRKMVIELKYDLALDDTANKHANYFPNRMSKHSKYVNGIEHFRSVAH